MHNKFFSAQNNPQKEGLLMSCGNNINKSIKCTVQQCKYHCNEKDYCSLDCITVGTHEMNPTESKCTDCKSFELGV